MSLPGKILIAAAVAHAVALALSVQGADGWPRPDVTSTNLTLRLDLEENPGPEGIWVDDSVGAGFRSDLRQAGLSAGDGFATHELGGRTSHDVMLSRVYYGWMLGKVAAPDTWYPGNWEVIQELFGGVQFRPSHRYLFGETTVLRYNLATRTRWIPFLDLGLGVADTDIRGPDLGSDFEFNEQIGPGVNYFWGRNWALNCQYRFLHLSNAGIRKPNKGVNENVFYAGVSWFF